jgi:arabinogalactan oligomer/maltooligosaccharide transport system permease protein
MSDSIARKVKNPGAKLRRRTTDTFIYLLLAVLSVIWLFRWSGWSSRLSVRSPVPLSRIFFRSSLRFRILSICGTTDISLQELVPEHVSRRDRNLYPEHIPDAYDLVCPLADAFPLPEAVYECCPGARHVPGFMSMIAVYYVLKAINLTQSLVALVLVYSAGAGINYYICKGFFDTVPRALDEAARIDGATNAQIFSKIIMPLSGPIVVYTALMAFMAPWTDFIAARIIMGDNYQKYTVAIGMYQMIEKNNINDNFRQFNAGCVCIGVPIIIMFVIMQRFYVGGVTSGAVKS